MSVKLIIEMMPDKSVNVTGPMNDKILCYGLLELAKEIIADYVEAQKKAVHIVPANALPNSLGNGN
jgi:hypothetical protein